MKGSSSLWAVLAIAVSLFASSLRAQFVYVANSGGFPGSGGAGTVSGYTIDPSTGALTPIAGSPFAAGVESFSVAVDPSGTFVYVANQGSFPLSGTVSGYTINPSTGALTPIAGSPFGAGVEPASVAVDPSGKFVYVANQGGNVSGYTVDPRTGALTEIAGSPFAAGVEPFSVAVDTNGKFAYVANAGSIGFSGNVSAYTINPSTGALTEIAGSPFVAGSGPASVAVTPNGKFAYVANGLNTETTSNNVSGFTINRSTGALTEIAGSPFPAVAGGQPLSVAVDPNGKFAYVAILNAGGILGYTIDRSTGALTAIAGFPAGPFPFSVAVDPNGKFVYAACFGDSTNNLPGGVAGYTINPRTGALTAIAGSLFPAGTNPISVTISRSAPGIRISRISNVSRRQQNSAREIALYHTTLGGF